MIPQEKIDNIRLWLGLTKAQRARRGLPKTVTAMTREWGVSRETIRRLSMNTVARVESEEVTKQQEIEEVIANLRVLSKHNSQAAKTLLQFHGVLTEKQEVTHKLDGSLITREILRIRRELQDSGMATVFTEPRILSEESLLPPGQSEEGYNQV